MEEVKFEMRRHAKLIVWAVLALALSGVILLVALAANEIKEYRFIGQGLQMSNTITVSGKGEVMAVPDIAEFSFGVSEEGKTPKEAQTKVTAKMNPILEKLKNMGIDEKDIKTTDYQISPKYEYRTQVCSQYEGRIGYCPPDGQQTLVGYTERHMVAVKVRDVAKAGDVVAAVTGLGVNDVSGVNFVVDKQDEKMQEARRLAIADAKEKAKVLAKDLGVRVVSIVSFEDGGNYPIYAMEAKALDARAGMGVAAPSPQIPQGENKIVSNVNIVYAIDY